MKIIVENKCPFPNDNVPHEPYYVMPTRHAPQCLAEMAAYSAKELWLVCFTMQAISIVFVPFDQYLWDCILKVTEDLYGGDKIISPTKLHPIIPDLRKELSAFAAQQTKFMLEVPSFWGEVGPLVTSSFLSPYYVVPPVTEESPDLQEISHKLEIDQVECNLIIKESHQILHHLAKQAVMFMICNKDRMYDVNIPNALPLAYTMTGNSVTNEQARKLINKVKNTLADNDIPVLCYCYDGQWKNLFVEDDCGSPLTLLQIHLRTWSKVSKMSFNRLLHDISQVSKVKHKDLESVRNAERLQNGEIITFGNIEIHCSSHGTLNSLSMEGGIFNQSTLQLFRSIPGWPKEHGNEDTSSSSWSGKSNSSDLSSDEKNLLDVVNKDILQELGLTTDMQIVEENISDDWLPDINVEESNLEKLLTSKEFILLQDIVADLREFSPLKWGEFKTGFVSRHVAKSWCTLEILYDHRSENIEQSIKEVYRSYVVFSEEKTKLQTLTLFVMHIQVSALVTRMHHCRERKQNTKIVILLVKTIHLR